MNGRPSITLVDVLEAAAYGRMTASEARANLAGQVMPSEEAEMVKRGTWSKLGGYPLGEEGLRMVARDALDKVFHP